MKYWRSKKANKKKDKNANQPDVDVTPVTETLEEDDGGFHNGESEFRIPPPLPKTLPPSSESSASFRQFSDLNENSSLANNKMLPPWQTTSNYSNTNRQFQQLPILNLNSNSNNDHSPPQTPKRRANQIDMNNNNIENITLSSTSLSMRQPDTDRKPSTYKNLNDITTSATEFFQSTNMGSTNNIHESSSPNNHSN